jgi:hypothetical protein
MIFIEMLDRLKLREKEKEEKERKERDMLRK